MSFSLYLLNSVGAGLSRTFSLFIETRFRDDHDDLVSRLSTAGSSGRRQHRDEIRREPDEPFVRTTLRATTGGQVAVRRAKTNSTVPTYEFTFVSDCGEQDGFVPAASSTRRSAVRPATRVPYDQRGRAALRRQDRTDAWLAAPAIRSPAFSARRRTTPIPA
jgi:hypothetical protein